MTSPAAGALKTMFDAFASAGQLRNINKIICFRLESRGDYMLPSHGNPLMTRTKWLAYHAAILLVASIISRQSGEVVKVYAHDEGYHSADIITLELLGIQATNAPDYDKENPSGARELLVNIDSNTLVFAPETTVILQQQLSLITRPAALIWCPRPLNRQIKGEVRRQFSSEYGYHQFSKPTKRPLDWFMTPGHDRKRVATSESKRENEGEDKDEAASVERVEDDDYMNDFLWKCRTWLLKEKFQTRKEEADAVVQSLN
ncbi:hypothetical protein GGR57DRAFT_185265 [Xylariaceae sp. FL1272]|nr:hypothetical protein GGR57DRAFT_185265 [Xylariaceae sp. FL1272]